MERWPVEAYGPSRDLAVGLTRPDTATGQRRPGSTHAIRPGIGSAARGQFSALKRPRRVRSVEVVPAAFPGHEDALTCGKTSQGIVEVAGIEPASSGFSMGLLRAQPVLGCRDWFRYRRQCHSVSD